MKNITILGSTGSIGVNALNVIDNLNEDYKGGKTMLEKIHIKPRIGRVSIFNSKNIKHGVERVEGTRYTYIAWWQEN